MAPLVIGAAIHRCRLEGVFIDGVSSLNLLYAQALHWLGISPYMIQAKCVAPIFRIVPDAVIFPIGRVKLSVILGGPQNYEVEMLTFKVINVPSPYKAVLGRPALAHFDAVADLGRHRLHLPGPRRVITIRGNRGPRPPAASLCDLSPEPVAPDGF